MNEVFLDLCVVVQWCSGAVATQLAHNKSVKSACSPRVGVGFPQLPRFLPQPKNMHISLIGGSELPLSVCVTELCVCPAVSWMAAD